MNPSLAKPGLTPGGRWSWIQPAGTTLLAMLIAAGCASAGVRQWYPHQPVDEKTATDETGVPVSDTSITTRTVTGPRGNTKIRTVAALKRATAKLG